MKLSNYLSVLLSTTFATTSTSTPLVLAASDEPSSRRDDEPSHRLKKHGDKKDKSFGLACSAGGFTASTINAGVMRALQKQTIGIDGKERPALEVFDAMSASSGGNPSVAIYAYAQNTDSDELLEVDSLTRDPSEITMEMLEVMPDSKSIFKPFVTPVAPRFVLALFDALLFGGAVWEKAMYFLMLSPYSIPKGQPMADVKLRSDVKATPMLATSIIGPAKLYNWFYDGIVPTGYSPEFLGAAFENLEEINGGFTDLVNDFLLNYSPVTGVTEPQNYAMYNVTQLMDVTKNYGFQGTSIPAYGTHQEFYIPFTPPGGRGTMLFDRGQSNLTDDPIDFYGPLALSYKEVSSESDPFTLEEMLGGATDNVGILPDLAMQLNSYFEGIADRPITINIPFSSDSKRKMAITDGGLNDYDGVAPLLSQKINKIVAISTTWFSLFDQLGPEITELVNEVTCSLLHIAKWFGITYLFPNSFRAQPEEHVFNLYSNGEDQMLKLHAIFTKLQAAGEPLIATLEGLEVLDNPFYNIKGGWKADLTIIMFNGVPEKFVDLLPEELDVGDYENGHFTNKDFAEVPTMTGIPPGETAGTIDLPFLNFTIDIPSLFQQTMPLKASRLTTILIDWSIDHAWNGLSVDGEEMFGGFPNFFEDDSIEDSTDDEFEVMGVSDDDEVADVKPKKSKKTKGKKTKGKKMKKKKEKVKKPKLRV